MKTESLGIVIHRFSTTASALMFAVYLFSDDEKITWDTMI